MNRRQTTILWVSGRGLGFQASDSTLTQLTLQSTDPRNKKQLLGLPRSTWSERKQYIISHTLYMFLKDHFPPDCQYSLMIWPYRSSINVHSWACLTGTSLSTLIILKRRVSFPDHKQLEDPCHWAPGAAGALGPRVSWNRRKTLLVSSFENSLCIRTTAVTTKSCWLPWDVLGAGMCKFPSDQFIMILLKTHLENYRTKIYNSNMNIQCNAGYKCLHMTGL